MQVTRAGSILLALIGTPALGQDPATGRAAPGAVLEEVLVTGSRIKRQDYTSISPLVTLDAEQITLSGVTAVEDLLNDTPQLVPYFDRSANNPGAGAAFLNLRGLGPNRTLVTFNGRRLTPADEFGAVDINVIPSQLIERIEIVTGGASTVYGSDAMAGVVNFIVRDEFEGLEFTGQYDTFQEGDGAVVDGSMIFGFGTERGHLTGFLNAQERDPVLAGDRAFTDETLRENFGTGELEPVGSSTNPAGRIVFPRVPLPGTGGQPVVTTFDPDGTPRPFDRATDFYNFQPANYLQTPMERQSAALFGKYQLSASTELFAELLHSRTASSVQLAPAPAFVPVLLNVDNPLLTDAQRELFGGPLDPDGDGFAEFSFAQRLEDVGPRRSERDAESTRAVLGLRGDLGRAWDWEASYSHSRVRGEYITDNAVFRDRFAQALLVDPATGACVDPSGGCVPFNPFGLGISEEAVNFLRTGDIRENYEVDEDIFNVAFTGDLVELPAGALGVAGGFEYRKLSSAYEPDENFLGDNVLGYLASAPVSGSQDVTEFFVEALIPLLVDAPLVDFLGIEAGYRRSDYKFSGEADNWKAGVDWYLKPSVRFRAMAQRAIRAPNIDELFREARIRQTFFVDPAVDQCTASLDPVGNGLTDLCVAQGIARDQVGIYEATPGFPLVTFEDGGNTGLEPEVADTFTAGIVYQPEWAQDLSLSLDYYRIEIDNAIGTTPIESALSLCFDSLDPASQFCAPVVRGPSGDITEYTNPQFNLAALAVEGIDLTVEYRQDLSPRLALPGSNAFLALKFLGNYAMENTTQPTQTTTPIDCAGAYGGACRFGVDLRQIIPEYRATTRLSYQSGPLTLALAWQWVGPLDSHLDQTCEDAPQFCYPSELDRIEAHNYLELSSRFTFGEHGEVYGGVSNLTEEDPPLMGAGATQSNTAPQLYDVFGRRYFLGVRYRL